jgi:hypothetical protein
MLRPKPRGKNVFIPKTTSVGMGLGPKECKASRSFKRPMEDEKGLPARLGLVTRSLDLVMTVGVGLGLGPNECKASGSSKRPMETKERPIALQGLVAGSFETVDSYLESFKFDGVIAGASGSL